MAVALPIRLNGVIFSGSPGNLAAPCAPIAIEPIIDKLGTLVKGIDGTRNWFSYGGTERGWTIRWEDAPEATRDTLEAIYLLTSAFTYRDEHGDAYTVQTESGGWTESTGAIDASGNVFYSITLQIWKA
jgi:hypothetical protein